MKQWLLLLLLLPTFIFSQEIDGNWTGTLEFGAQKIKLSFAIEQDSSYLKASMSIPQQGVVKARASKVNLSNAQLEIEFSQYNISYVGNLKKDSIHGEFLQNGFKIPLHLTKGSLVIKRPQNPKAPFNYSTEEVSFINPIAGIELQGTLSMPKEKPDAPIVIIISGSGPQNRDGDLFGHALYYVLADHLSNNGIGVLRFDERGVGSSAGDYKSGDIQGFSEDASAALSYLKSRKEYSKNKIGLIGHSLGGIIAAKIASETPEVNFLILMAAPGVSGDLLMLQQKADFEKKMGVTAAQIKQGQELMRGIYDLVISQKQDLEHSLSSIDQYLMNMYGSLLPQAQKAQLLKQLGSPEIMSLIRSEPQEFLSKLHIPVLAINGTRDIQVLASANLLAIEKALPKNSQNKIQAFEGLNHLFQEAATGLPSEYYSIEQTISDQALLSMSQWVLKLKL